MKDTAERWARLREALSDDPGKVEIARLCLGFLGRTDSFNQGWGDLHIAPGIEAGTDDTLKVLNALAEHGFLRERSKGFFVADQAHLRMMRELGITPVVEAQTAERSLPDYKELHVRGDAEPVGQFLDALDAEPPAGWKRDVELEERINASDVMRCYSRASDEGHGDIALWLAKREDGTLYVSNIVPTQRALRHAEYNSFIEEFASGVTKLAEDTGVSVTTTRGELKLLDRLSEAASRAFTRSIAWSNGCSRRHR